jgi:hypothetical protein
MSLNCFSANKIYHFLWHQYPFLLTAYIANASTNNSLSCKNAAHLPNDGCMIMLTSCDVISIVQTSGRISTTSRVSKCRPMAVN